MKLLLVNPYFRMGRTRETLAAVDAPPLGLGFLATYIRDRLRWEVEVLDPVVQGLEYDEVLDRATRSDAVGVSCYADIRFNALDFVRDVRHRTRSVRTVLGGPHASSLPSEILREVPEADFVVRGEGEITLAELLSGKDPASILGLTHRQGDRVIMNPDRPFMDSIDGLYVDYGFFRALERYPSDIEAPEEFRRLKNGYLIASRGCPFECGFCSNEQWKRRWRAVSPVRLVEEMVRPNREHGMEYFRFYDDLFTANEARVEEFCRCLKASGLKARFRVLCRAGTRRGTLESLRDAGCVSVGLGIESGSDRVLKIMNKGTNLETIAETVSICRELGLWVVGSLVLSIPGETIEDVRQTFRATRLPDSVMVNIHKLYPNTPFYRDLKGRGEVEDSVWFDRSIQGPLIYCRDRFPSARFWLKELKWFSLKAQYLHTLHHPGHALRNFGWVHGAYKVIKALLDIPLRGRLNRIACAIRGTPPL